MKTIVTMNSYYRVMRKAKSNKINLLYQSPSHIPLRFFDPSF